MSSTYTVKSGDTLSKIAAAHGCGWKDLQELNNIADPNSIRPGQQLKLPGGGSDADKPPSGTAAASGEIGDDWARLVEQHGDSKAKADFAEGKRVVIAIRHPTSTKANQGRGVYDDEMIVVRKAKGGVEAITFKCNTDPSGQYGPGGVKKDMGYDVDRDGDLDQGRLLAGTYHYVTKPGGHLGGPAFWVQTTQTAERDVNNDGVFNSADGANRIDGTHAGRTMYIHQGDEHNTWSAGCQTLAKSQFSKFIASLGGQSSFSYILINAS